MTPSFFLIDDFKIIISLCFKKLETQEEYLQQIQKRNINLLFKRTIHPFDYLQKIYVRYYDVQKRFNMTKKTQSELHTIVFENILKRLQ